MRALDKLNRKTVGKRGYKELELSEIEKELRGNPKHMMLEVLKRAHSGRWPTFLVLRMLRREDEVLEAAQWRVMQRRQEPEYCVMQWDLKEKGIRWKELPSAKLALRYLEELRRKKEQRGKKGASSWPGPKRGSQKTPQIKKRVERLQGR